jgi:GLPGLI family protein
MKPICLFLSLFLFSFFLKEHKSVVVEYVVKIQDEKDLFSTNSSARKLFDRAISNADNLSFNLIIIDSVSKFYVLPGLEKSESEAFKIYSTLFTGYTGIVFQYANNIYTASSFIDREVMIKENLKTNWVLHNDTKMIDNYLCYKATNTNTIDNGQGKTFNHPVIAWYCPKLPYSYGPNGYSNLPGLILELQVRNVIYGANKIDLNSNLQFDTSFLKTVKTITLEELNNKLKKEAESWKN